MENLKGIIHDIANKLAISKAINRNLSNLLGKDHKDIIRLKSSIEESVKLLSLLKEKSSTVKRKLPLENILTIKENEFFKIQSLSSLYDIEIEYRNDIETDAWVNLNSYSNDRILCNCIENAKNAGATRILIEYKLKESHLQLNIKDNGAGMNRDVLERIGFGYTSQDGEGHGQGTQVIRSMVQELGGSVEWSSIEDLGTCCKLKYKLENDLEVINQRIKIISESEKINHSSTAISGKKILVVSKSPMELGIWKDFLNGIGANTITCEYGDAALNLIYRDSPHCILIGKEFKDMSSLEWLKIVNSESSYNKIPKILYITESDDIEELNKYQIEDIINYSHFDDKKIFEKIECLLKKKKSNSEIESQDYQFKELTSA
ncbi:ATP-binding protein [Halobacteriovorax sp. HLS]|uniref:ATP-binding protein n=1 Tax=Halobacteriovorax sp. HLS TaxID=2234000 RepID=UPI000FDB3BA2|nr:ATP-binding protein [Halobacteriovorax sp. HLS]